MTDIPDRIIECPGCAAPMIKLIISRPDGPVTIDHCRLCEGYWFDGLELEKVIKGKMEVTEFLLEPSEVHEADFPCPRCSCKMETKVLFDVRVDKCMDCEGLWLDKGELKDIQERYRLSMNDHLFLELIRDILIETDAIV